MRRVSKKRQEKLDREAIQVELLWEQCKGFCMQCGKQPDWRGLSKSHTKKRDRFILVCFPCHEGGNKLGSHKYLEE